VNVQPFPLVHRCETIKLIRLSVCPRARIGALAHVRQIAPSCDKLPPSCALFRLVRKQAVSYNSVAESATSMLLGRGDPMRKRTLIWIFGFVLAWSAAASGQSTGDILGSGPSDEAVARVMVRGFPFDGNIAVSDADLISLLKPMIGHELTLTDLQMAALAVSLHYRELGYFLAEAILPPQEIIDGIVAIHVFEGRYDEIVLRNESRLQDSVALSILSPLGYDAPIIFEPYERATLLLSDLSGVEPRFSFAPGSRLGTANLEVILQDGPPVSGQLTIDVSGEGDSVIARPATSVDFDNATGRGDSLKFTLSGDPSSRVVGALYTLPRARGATYTAQYSDAQRSASIVNLKARSWTQNFSVSANYAVLRSTEENQSVSISLDHNLSGSSLANASATEKRTKVSLGLQGDRSPQDDRSSHYSLLLTAGVAMPEGGSSWLYQKINGSYTHTRRLGPQSQVSASLSAQLALTRLDVSERMTLGVRGYPSGGSGDSGWFGKLELRRLLNWPQWPGPWQVAGYVEGGEVQGFPQGSSPFFIQRYGVGLSLTWSLPGSSTLHFDRAWPIGAEPGSERRGQMSLTYTVQF